MKKLLIFLTILKFTPAKAQTDTGFILNIIPKASDTIIKYNNYNYYRFNGMYHVDIIKDKKAFYKKVYFESGELKSICKVEVVIVGMVDYTDYPDSSINSLASHYFDVIGDGKFIEYYKNKKIKVIGKYKKGLKIGKWKYFDENGFKTKEVQWYLNSKGNEIEYTWWNNNTPFLR